MARTPFIFRLERLLDVRMMREKQAQQELLVRIDRLRQEEAVLEGLRQIGIELVNRMTPDPGEVIDIEDRQYTEIAIKQNLKQQQGQQQKIVSAERAVVEQEQAVKQARIDVKVLEKLKERKREEWHEEELRKQAAFLDDVSTQQFMRREAEDLRVLSEAADAVDADKNEHDFAKEAGGIQ